MHVTLVKTPTVYSYRNTNYLRHLQHTEALHQSNVYEKVVQYTKPLLVKFSAYIIWSKTMISGHSALRIEAPYNIIGGHPFPIIMYIIYSVST